MKKQEIDDNEKVIDSFRPDSKSSGRKSRSSSSQVSSRSTEKLDSPKCLPIIPGNFYSLKKIIIFLFSYALKNFVKGIGPQISAREVANIGVWMNECARRQAGLVGPRNIRHINCPSLEGRYSKKN